jgi:hypothetical protein
MEEVTNNKPISEFREILKLFIKYLRVASASIPAGILCYLMIFLGFSQEWSLVFSFLLAVILISSLNPFNYLYR